MKSRIPIQNYSTDIPIDFSKIRVGAKTLEDAVLDISGMRRLPPRFSDKKAVVDAIEKLDFPAMREISNAFYRTSGIYNRLCRYMAYMYRYDWFITPYMYNVKDEKAIEGFDKSIQYLEKFNPKKFFGEVSLKVMRNGCYYGYKVETSDGVVVQELPVSYCRTKLVVGGTPAVEFNLKYFDECFTEVETRQKILNLFPKEFKHGYNLYKTGKLPKDFFGKTTSWYMLDPAFTIKFNLNGDDFPPLMSVIPAIIDLDDAQALDKKKMQQRLLKIIIQKMPLNKDSELVFDVDEAQALHNNAVNMLRHATGVDVLTTFADVDVADMDTNAATTATDDLERIERAIFNEAGISQLQFNSDNSVSLEKSIANDEASLWNLIQQYETFLNTLLKPFNQSPKKILYKATILPTTIYNYQNLAKLYKEQTQLGYSKMLPQIALGQSQASTLATAHFENEVLDLVSVFIPPMTSNTMNAQSVTQLKGAGKSSSGSGSSSSSGEGAGRPTNEELGKPTTEKTAANKESQ